MDSGWIRLAGPGSMHALPAISNYSAVPKICKVHLNDGVFSSLTCVVRLVAFSVV